MVNGRWNQVVLLSLSYLQLPYITGQLMMSDVSFGCSFWHSAGWKHMCLYYVPSLSCL